jgi:hypothetical protein
MIRSIRKAANRRPTARVFATRSPRRPNPVALTVVELLSWPGPIFQVGVLDMLEGTPILDVKTYLSNVPPEKFHRGWLAEAEAGAGAKPIAWYRALETGPCCRIGVMMVGRLSFLEQRVSGAISISALPPDQPDAKATCRDLFSRTAFLWRDPLEKHRVRSWFRPLCFPCWARTHVRDCRWPVIVAAHTNPPDY